MDQTHSNGHRLAGLFLMLGAFALPFIIIDYISIMAQLEPGAGMAERAALARDNFDGLALGWRFEIIAMGLLAAGAIAMVPHGVGVAGWALAAVGILITAPMYPIMLGGYKEVLFADPMRVEDFAMLRAIANVLFYVGGLLYHTGFGIALIGEALFQKSTIWKLILGIGAVANLIGAAGFGLAYGGMEAAFMVAGPLAILAFVIIGLKGAKLARG
ncbi:MAG: hypothetical protein AAFR65_12495 [Pseudomonadota bacterium]